MTDLEAVLRNQKQYAVVHTDVLAGLRQLPDECIQVVFLRKIQ